MNQVSINITFNSLDELHAFLQNNPAAAQAKVASAQPSPAPAAAPSPAPAATVTPITAATPAAATPAAAPEVDLKALQADLMNKLTALAQKVTADGGDVGEIGGFINGFGVQRFSDIPLEQLPTFQQQFEARFGG